jgi:peptidoglycan hydrolase-like protein with peptidoglycan-binding domain
VPQAVQLSLLRRLSALVALLALVLSAPAFAQTGGTESQAPEQEQAAAPAPQKKPTTKQVQKALGIKADGVLGPKTKRALKTYQRRNGLKVTGKADTATLRSLGLIGQPQSSTPLAATPIPAEHKAILDQIAQCESGGNLAAQSPDGRYFGKYQFSQPTWEAMGGSGSPAAADEATQDALAYKLFQARGTAPWPSCSAQLEAAAEDAG